MMKEFGDLTRDSMRIVNKIYATLARKDVTALRLTVGNSTVDLTKKDARDIQLFLARTFKTLTKDVGLLFNLPKRASSARGGPRGISQLVKLVSPTQALVDFVYENFDEDVATHSNVGTSLFYQTLLRQYLSDTDSVSVEESNVNGKVSRKSVYRLPAGSLRTALQRMNTGVDLDRFTSPKVSTLVSFLVEKDAAGHQVTVEPSSQAGKDAFVAYRKAYAVRKAELDALKDQVGRGTANPDGKKSDYEPLPEDYTNAAITAGIIDNQGNAITFMVDETDERGNVVQVPDNNVAWLAYYQDYIRATLKEQKAAASS